MSITGIIITTLSTLLFLSMIVANTILHSDSKELEKILKR